MKVSEIIESKLARKGGSSNEEVLRCILLTCDGLGEQAKRESLDRLLKLEYVKGAKAAIYTNEFEYGFE